MSRDNEVIEIRPAIVDDAATIAVLCGQLGYPISGERIRVRLEQLLGNEAHALYVAERAGRYVIGWVHICVRPLVIADRHAQIEGLVVEDKYRRSGVGRLLMDAAESWARARACEFIYVRSNIVRTGAHRFYERLGYAEVKTQRSFLKNL